MRKISILSSASPKSGGMILPFFSLTIRHLLVLVAISSVFFACSKNDAGSPDESQKRDRECATDVAVKAMIATDPSLLQRMNRIESLTERMIASGQLERGAGQTIVIPVVVHVIYNTQEENLSDAQIKSQIDVLNEDFNLRNSDRNLIPSIFSGVAGDVGVRFELAQTIRKYSNKPSWPANDAMKFSNRGGSDAVDPANNLNIWVCDLQKYLGYAYYPGITPELDGVVVWYQSFGRTGTLFAPYDKGRTTTHEVGHYLNLRHIWGDATCGSDAVDDTPQHNTYNFGCPAFPHYSTCAGTPIEMTMNYMDYTDDPCMYMFTNGQKSRMLSLFVAGGARETLAE